MLVGASSESPERALSVDRMPQHDGALGRDDGHILFTVVVDQVAHTLKHLVLGPHLVFNKKIISVFLFQYFFFKLCHRGKTEGITFALTTPSGSTSSKCFLTPL